jgi:hypothetical protein
LITTAHNANIGWPQFTASMDGIRQLADEGTRAASEQVLESIDMYRDQVLFATQGLQDLNRHGIPFNKLDHEIPTGERCWRGEAGLP